MVFELTGREAATAARPLGTRAGDWLRGRSARGQAHLPVFRQFSQTLLGLAKAEAGRANGRESMS